jgi:O-antigen/teichoic acid export membrane protein
MRSAHPTEPANNPHHQLQQDDAWDSQHEHREGNGLGVHPPRRSVLSARTKRLAAGVLATVLTRGVGILVPLLLIPATLGYLGADLYGLWMAVAALTGMAAFADLGLGNSLMTKLAPCYSIGDTHAARRYISSAYLTLGGMAGTACALLWLTAGLVPWASVFNAEGTATAADARAMALVCLTAFIVNVPLSLINRLQYAYQQIAQSNAWQAVGSLATMPLTFGAIWAGLPAVAVVAATVVGPLLVNAVNSICFFCRQMPALLPSVSRVDRATSRELLQLSGMFLTLTIVMSVANSMDTLVISHALGLASVTAFAVPARLFAQLGLLVSVVNLPLWSANADALAQGQTAWVRRVARRMTLASLAMAVVTSVGLVCVGDRLLSTWLGVSMETGGCWAV